MSDLKKKAVGGNELGDEAERTAVLVHSLKIEIGTRMLEPLKSGAQVERALAEATEVYRTQHLNAFRSAALNEAETFYKDLLKDYK
ncbi:MAG: hypothetical protein LC127_00125 [Chitinophagales bacterium]|nr:hypothetical protein [Chitinophagales bacterium]